MHEHFVLLHGVTCVKDFRHIIAHSVLRSFPVCMNTICALSAAPPRRSNHKPTQPPPQTLAAMPRISDDPDTTPRPHLASAAAVHDDEGTILVHSVMALQVLRQLLHPRTHLHRECTPARRSVVGARYGRSIMPAPAAWTTDTVPDSMRPDATPSPPRPMLIPAVPP